MPNVSDKFVSDAEMLSKAVPALLDKVAQAESSEKSAAEGISANAELVADTLVERGLLRESEKSAAVEKLRDHRGALSVLSNVSQKVVAPRMGTVKQAEEKPAGRESDRALLSRLGLSG